LGLFYSCGSIKFTNDYIIPTSLKKVVEPSLLERQNWYNLDISDDSIPGMSVDKAYNELLKGLKADTVIVAVIDTGIDIYHEDLQGLIWVNGDEIPNNGKDDDNNGYVDDIHGWNYLEDAYDETLEMTRLLRDGIKNNRKYNDAKSEINANINESNDNLSQYKGYVEGYEKSKKIISKYLTNDDFSSDDLKTIVDDSLSEDILNAKEFLTYFMSIDISLDYLIDYVYYFESILYYMEIYFLYFLSHSENFSF
jgi:subtilisin family serine protease